MLTSKLTRLRMIFALLLAAACSSLSAQSRYFMTVEDTKKSTEGIVASMSAGNPADALKELRLISAISTQQFDLFEAQFNNQEVELIRRFGEPQSYEYLRSDELGTHLVRHQFLVDYSRAPVRWTFVFYRSPRGWTLNDFRFDAVSVDFFNAPTSQVRTQ